jgi:DNA-binding transcriptional LysR family regulator
VRLRVRVSDSAGALHALLADECDLALTGSSSGDRRLLLTTFAEDQVVLVGPSPNRFAPSGRLETAELARVPLIVREAGSGTQRSVAGFLAAHGLRGAVELGSTEAVKRAARAGMGLAFVSRLAVEEELGEGKLQAVEVPGLPLARSFYVARFKGVTLSAAASELLRLLTRPARRAPAAPRPARARRGRH